MIVTDGGTKHCKHLEPSEAHQWIEVAYEVKEVTYNTSILGIPDITGYKLGPQIKNTIYFCDNPLHQEKMDCYGLGGRKPT